jgi:cytochrome oxidase Cu insertion factor (SCO1/SenC/PrrC family)
MKYFILLTIAILSIAKSSYSQADSISISGRVDTSLRHFYPGNELILMIRSTVNKDGIGKQIKTTLNSKGHFSIKVPADSLIYLSFNMVNNSGYLTNVSFYNRKSLTYFDEVYLFEKGDSIHASIMKEGLFNFKGKGADKLNCQFQIYMAEALQLSAKLRATQLGNSSNFTESLKFQSNMLDLAIQMRLEILSTYKSQISDKIYSLLSLDAIASAKHQMLVQLSLLVMIYPNDIKAKYAAKEYYLTNFNSNITSPQNPEYLAASAYYADMLFVKETTYLKLFSDTTPAIKYDLFTETFNLIKHKYSGVLRDKLLYICFERLNSYDSSKAKSLLEEAFIIIQDPKYKQLLFDWKAKNLSAYPFDLPDANGKSHKLSDYKGKLIVIDFWYTGCSYCMALNKAMSTIIQKYKNNRKVVFLTVSIDIKKDLWLKSISSGNYTSPETINLYTNGKGAMHPIIQNYNFNGYPQQLIIDKNGKLITSSPPRADVGKAQIDGLINIINSNL